MWCDMIRFSSSSHTASSICHCRVAAQHRTSTPRLIWLSVDAALAGYDRAPAWHGAADHAPLLTNRPDADIVDTVRWPCKSLQAVCRRPCAPHTAANFSRLRVINGQPTSAAQMHCHTSAAAVKSRQVTTAGLLLHKSSTAMGSQLHSLGLQILHVQDVVVWPVDIALQTHEKVSALRCQFLLMHGLELEGCNPGSS